MILVRVNTFICRAQFCTFSHFSLCIFLHLISSLMKFYISKTDLLTFPKDFILFVCSWVHPVPRGFKQRPHCPQFVETGPTEQLLPLPLQRRGLPHPQGCRGSVRQPPRVSVISCSALSRVHACNIIFINVKCYKVISGMICFSSPFSPQPVYFS